MKSLSFPNGFYRESMDLNNKSLDPRYKNSGMTTVHEEPVIPERFYRESMFLTGRTTGSPTEGLRGDKG